MLIYLNDVPVGFYYTSVLGQKQMIFFNPDAK